MSRMIAAMAVVLLVTGCGGTDSEGSQGAANTAADEVTEQAYDAAKPAVDAAEKVADAASGVINDAVTASNTISGVAGCGHCDFKTTSSCAAALKAEDGKIYVLDGIESDSDVFQKTMKGKSVTLDGELQVVDGTLHMEVASFKVQ